MNARWGSGAGREGGKDSIIRFLSSESQRDTLEAVESIHLTGMLSLSLTNV